jgi:hypothetical protein
MFREGDIVTTPWGAQAKVVRAPRPDGVMLIACPPDVSEGWQRITEQELATGKPPRGWIPRRVVAAKRPGYENWRIRVRVVPHVGFVPSSARWRRAANP